MIPILFEIGPIKIYSFGLMMGLAFIVAHFLLIAEFKRKGMSPDAAGQITLIALVAGLVGSKLFSILENFGAFLADPAGEAFSAAGLTFFGGLITATLAIWYYVHRKRLGFLRVADAASPSLMIAYGIGRIGCQLAGDGDYGIPTDVPWAMTYPEGTVSTLKEANPGLAEQFAQIFPGQPIPVDIPVHPAPVYETLASLLIFLLLWKLRTRPWAAGALFGLYLIGAGVERLAVEFIRLNPLYAGLSQAQWISIGMMILGATLLYTRLQKGPQEEIPATPSRAERRRTQRS